MLENEKINQKEIQIKIIQKQTEKHIDSIVVIIV